MAKDQSNLTDPDSRLMKKNQRADCEQSCNAQATVEAEGSQLIVGQGVSQNCNDKQELAAGVASIPEELGSSWAVLADNGYANGAEVEKVKADWLRKMAEKLQTEEGKQLYALRKQTVEPVFGVIKSALGFRMFSLRGIELVRGEWNLVTLVYNCKRIHTLRLAERH